MPEYESIIKDIADRLKTFGVLYNELKDEWLMKFLSKEVMNEIKSECNLHCIPRELYEKMIDQICGKFLHEKRNKGTLHLEKLNEANIVSSIKEGDTQVNFVTDNLSSSQRLDMLIDKLMTSITEADYISFRRFRW